jgi:hypothetical protein
MSDEIRFIDMFDKKKQLEAVLSQPAAKEVAAERLAICKACPHFRKFTQQCKICNCHMPWKVTLAQATCALPDPKFPGEDRKWDVAVPNDEEIR